MKTIPQQIPVLGTPVTVCSYQSATEAVSQMARRGQPAAVCASNTHIISLARHQEDFGDVMRRFDLLLPDGMPLVWWMNRHGAELDDRVYGPYFMRYALQNLGRPWKHYFFGGREETLKKLVEAAKSLNPDIDIVGTYSPPFRQWNESDHEEHARRIRESGADFIWVALGGERQERWIIEQQTRFQRGVFVAIGDAFELLAGSRPFAPVFIQKWGLTWLYRLLQEPRRLWPRYFKFNSLFVYYVMRDAILGSPVWKDGKKSLRIAFLGSRGVPARYSGFETVVEEVGAELAARGHEVIVYGRSAYYQKSDKMREYRGMRVVNLPTIMNKNLETIVHTLLSILHAALMRLDVVYLCGVGNSLLAAAPKFFSVRTIINVDGADFRRLKWSRPARWWLRKSELWAVKFADVVIADNQSVVRHYKNSLNYEPTYLSYGVSVRTSPVHAGQLEEFGLEAGGYVIYVSRLTPENRADMLLRARHIWANRQPELPPLVIVGGAGYEREYYEELKGLADSRVIFTGYRFADAYVELCQNARFFVMPAAIEATRLVLLDQMGMGTAVLYRDCAASREVMADAGTPFGKEQTESPDELLDREPDVEEALAEKMQWLWQHPEECKKLGAAGLVRAGREYSWKRVADGYEKLMGAVP